MNLNNLHYLNLWGIGLIIARFYDGYKYYKQTQKIKKVGVAKGHSRDFGNIAIGVDGFMLLYFIYKNWDLYMIISTILMLLFVGNYWLTLYRFYPYRMRGCHNFKRPNLLVYFLNSIQLDKYRRRL
jgi:hypothetical protein